MPGWGCLTVMMHTWRCQDADSIGNTHHHMPEVPFTFIWLSHMPAHAYMRLVVILLRICWQGFVVFCTMCILGMARADSIAWASRNFLRAIPTGMHGVWIYIRTFFLARPVISAALAKRHQHQLLLLTGFAVTSCNCPGRAGGGNMNKALKIMVSNKLAYGNHNLSALVQLGLVGQ